MPLAYQKKLIHLSAEYTKTWQFVWNATWADIKFLLKPVVVPKFCNRTHEIPGTNSVLLKQKENSKKVKGFYSTWLLLATFYRFSLF